MNIIIMNRKYEPHLDYVFTPMELKNMIFNISLSTYFLMEEGATKTEVPRAHESHNIALVHERFTNQLGSQNMLGTYHYFLGSNNKAIWGM